MGMNERERYWIDMCRKRKDEYVIVVDNDAAYVVEIFNGACVFEFNHYGWELALDLFKHIGCNAEGA